MRAADSKLLSSNRIVNKANQLPGILLEFSTDVNVRETSARIIVCYSVSNAIIVPPP